MSAEDLANGLDSDGENAKILKEFFTIKDFLEFDETRNILRQEFHWEFDRKCLPDLENFYKQEVDHCNYSLATVFDNEIEHEHIGTFIGMVRKHIKPVYDLSIFYDSPSLASGMISAFERKIEESKKSHAKRITNYRKC